MPTGPNNWNYCGGLTGKTMNVPKIDIKQLLEAGVHLGHKNFRWNPKNEEIYFWRKKFNSHY